MVGGPKPISGTRHPLVSKNDKGAIGFCFEDLKNFAQNLPGSFIDIKQVSNSPLSSGYLGHAILNHKNLIGSARGGQGRSKYGPELPPI